MPAIFVSFRRSDSTAIAGRIYERLAKKFDLSKQKQVNNDVGQIPANVEPSDYISELIQEYSVLLLVIGPNWAAGTLPDGTRRLDAQDDVVRLEIEAALKLERPILIAFVGGAGAPDAAWLPTSIQPILNLKPVIFESQDTFRRDINTLIREITQALALRQDLKHDLRHSVLDPDRTRQAVLLGRIHSNLTASKSPLAGVRLKTLGEVNWFVQGRTGSGLPRKVQKDLAGADLSYTNLSNGLLEGVNLSGADLTGAILTAANLKEAHLNHAKLSGADLTGVHSQAADLTAADLTGAILTDAGLAGAKLNAAILAEASMDRVDLRGAALQDADLSDAKLLGAHLSGALLERTKLISAILDGAQLDKVTLDDAVLEQASLRGADLSDASVTGAELDQTTLAGANLQGADLTGAKFNETDLSGAILAGTKLDAADDILKKLKFGLDVSLDQVAWNGIEVQPITKGMSRNERIAVYRDYARVNQRISSVLRGLGLQTEASKYRLKEQNTQRKILFLQRKYGG